MFLNFVWTSKFGPFLKNENKNSLKNALFNQGDYCNKNTIHENAVKLA